ncbi:MAG: hypothetical protein K6A63_05290 [Acholeplasmatales bacterium]|nr:hypothetical protein [Acholeplasmatales bacterium]
MKKKLLGIGLIALATLGLASCGSAEKVSGESNATSSSAASSSSAPAHSESSLTPSSQKNEIERYVSFDAKAATCDKAGNIAYTVDVYTGKYYEGNSTTVEINPFDVVIPAGHEFVDGKCTKCEKESTSVATKDWTDTGKTYYWGDSEKPFETRTYSDFMSQWTKIGTGDFYGFTDSSFTNKLEAPTREVNDAFMVADVYDYCAFYKEASCSLVFPSTFTNDEITACVNKGYWYSKTLPGVVNFTFEITGTTANVSFIYSEAANTYKSAKSYIPTTIPYLFISDGGTRCLSDDDFGYYDNKNGALDVYNSDQLVYALEEGYVPNCLPGSPAEKLLNDVKVILNGIICNDMSDEDKLIAIMCWMMSNSSYDGTADVDICFIDDKNYPDEIAALNTAFYAEGVFYGGNAVCHGFAKAYALMAGILGIKVSKTSVLNLDLDYTKTISSFVYDEDFGGIYSSHGYCYVELEGKSYICDPTYNVALSRNVKNNDLFLYRVLAAGISYNDWKKVYKADSTDGYYELNKDKMAEESINVSSLINIYHNEKPLDLRIDSINEAEEMTSYLKDYLDSYANPFYLNGSYSNNVATCFTLNFTAPENIYSTIADYIADKLDKVASFHYIEPNYSCMGMIYLFPINS